MTVLQKISKLFSNEVAETVNGAPEKPAIEKQDDARIIHDVLFVLFPKPELEMTAYDDYYPMMLYGFDNMPGANRFTQVVQNFMERLHDCLEDEGEANSLCRQHSELLRIVVQALKMPAGEFNNYCGNNLSLVRSPEETVQQHLKDNVRYKTLHTEGLEQFVNIVERHEKNGPSLRNATGSGFGFPKP